MAIVKKNVLLICLIISSILIFIATLLYPGGSLMDPSSKGFNWSENFFSNLFEAEAINGAANSSRIWGLLGIAFHSLGYGVFFFNMSRKMPDRHTFLVLRTISAANILFTVLIATPMHDMMVTLSSTLFLIGLFYITVSILRTKLHVLKFACILCLVLFYYTLFLYGSGNWRLLAIMQKVSFISSMLLVLGLDHFTDGKVFEHVTIGGKARSTHRSGSAGGPCGTR